MKFEDRVQAWVARAGRSRRGMRKLAACCLIPGAALSYVTVSALLTGEVRGRHSPGYSRATEPIHFWGMFGVLAVANGGTLGLGLYFVYRSVSDKSLAP